jgi:competence protein ComEC
VVEASRGAGVAVDHAARGRTFTFSPGLEVEVLSPEPGPVPEEEDEDIVNAQSLVLLGRVGGVRVLLPGDIAAREQEELVGPAVRADVLVAPHHGSADIDPAFVEAVDPRATLVTVGADNRFGHPTSTALRAYALQGGVLRTDRQGTVAVCVGDGALEVTTER